MNDYAVDRTGLFAALAAQDRGFHVSPHFTLGELTRSAVAEQRGIVNWPVEGGQPIGVPELVENLIVLTSHILEPLRERFGAFAPNSVYRCFALNKALGSRATSQHMLGQAADVEIPGLDNGALADELRRRWIFDQLILESHHQGVPSSGWVHVSFRAGASGANRQQCLTIRSDGTTLPGLVV